MPFQLFSLFWILRWHGAVLGSYLGQDRGKALVHGIGIVHTLRSPDLTDRSNEAALTAQSAYDPEDPALIRMEADLTRYALKYARLDQYGRDAVEAIIRAEYNRCRCENTLCPATAYSGHISIKREEAIE